MPSDIRNFFGGGIPRKDEGADKSKKQSSVKKTKTGRKLVEDSDDDGPITRDLPNKKSTLKKTKREPSPIEEVTTTSDYFGKSKPKKSASRGAQLSKETPHSSPIKGANSKTTTPVRLSSRKKPAVDYSESREKVIVDDIDNDDTIFAAEYKSNGRGQADDYEEDEDDDFEEQFVKPKGLVSSSKSKKADKNGDVEMHDFEDDDDDDDDILDLKSSKRGKPSSTAGKKRKSIDLLDDDDEEITITKKAKASKTSTPKKPAQKREKKPDEPENPEMQAIFDSIPTVQAPPPPGATAGGDGEKPKFKYGAQHANSGPPPDAGAFEMPHGNENCLAGLSFVFTGLLNKLGRDEGIALIKRYGGKVVTAPSSKTDFVVLGNDAGPKKLQTIKQHSLKTIDEDGLADLIRKLPANGGSSKAAAKFDEKLKAEEEKIKEAAAAMDEADRIEQQKAAKTVEGQDKSKGKQSASVPDARLWTVKYAPQDMRSICGNKGQVEKLQRWLNAFPKSQKKKFKLGGPDGSGTFRAVMISGPPGIGKTTAAHLVAKLEGYDVVESNASDTRSKKLVETGLNGVLNTTSLTGYFAGDGQRVTSEKKKLVLIMDEVDGMSAGDRGGVGALAAICKKTQVPMILICNEINQPKMKPFQFVTYALRFSRPTTEMIRTRIKTIAFREKLSIPGNVIDALIENTGADIRQVINMVSTIKLDEQAMDYDKGKAMSKAWQKHVVLKPWDIVGKVLGGGMFASSSKSTLNDKIELYFNDHQFSFLMLQENYLGTTPVLANNLQGRQKNLKILELAEKAAASISDGDLVDRMIHGPEQQWSLMPTHAIFSFVRPASYVAGSMAGHGQTRFTQWMGNNSSQTKFFRLIKDVQGHMRLRASADRHEIRQYYMPCLWDQTVKKLEKSGRDAVPEVIDLMDSYFLTKDDYDSIVELGVGYMKQDDLKIDSQTKATFTRMYNAQSHPLPFMKSSQVLAPKGGVPKIKPDLEEALDESDDEAIVEEPQEEENNAEVDVTKDKYVKQPKKKKATTKASGKAKKGEDNEENLSESDSKSKKSRGGGNGKGKGKGKANK